MLSFCIGFCRKLLAPFFKTVLDSRLGADGAHHHHAGASVNIEHSLEGRDAGHFGHDDVEQHELWFELLVFLHGLGAAAGGGDDFKTAAA